MKNYVSINLKKDQIIIKLAQEAKHEEILEQLTQKIPALKKLYQEEKTPITVAGKVLKNKEIEEIKKIIEENLEVNVSFDMPQSLGLSSIKRTFKKKVDVSETEFHKGSLRSGQKIEVEGSVVILGDVNSGAEVVASENIIILGNLRGLAHAGAKGNKKAMIAAGGLEAVQIRIANIVKEIDKKEKTINKRVYIYAEENKIIIE